MKYTIGSFAASTTIDGLPQSRFPSHVPQIIAGFTLYWVLQVCDHHLYFGDAAFARSFLPRIDGVLSYFDQHIDSRGLVSGLPSDVWQFVDWVTTWGATDTHPDKGVPTSGRSINLHTYFSMLYAHVLKEAAKLLQSVGRSHLADEYLERAQSVNEAIRTHCYDGRYFTDSLASHAQSDAYSQHCQVFAVICGAASPSEAGRLLRDSFADESFSKCSYMMMFYAFRALAIAGDDVYESYWSNAWDPWRQMLRNNLTTWQEDDVRLRSDCHAWGSVPIYEYCTELAGVRPLSPGCCEIEFRPRINLSDSITATVALGNDNAATVTWKRVNEVRKEVILHLSRPAKVVSQLPGQPKIQHGEIQDLRLDFGV